MTKEIHESEVSESSGHTASLTDSTLSWFCSLLAALSVACYADNVLYAREFDGLALVQILESDGILLFLVASLLRPLISPGHGSSHVEAEHLLENVFKIRFRARWS